MQKGKMANTFSQRCIYIIALGSLQVVSNETKPQ